MPSRPRLDRDSKQPSMLTYPINSPLHTVSQDHPTSARLALFSPLVPSPSHLGIKKKPIPTRSLCRSRFFSGARSRERPLVSMARWSVGLCLPIDTAQTAPSRLRVPSYNDSAWDATPAPVLPYLPYLDGQYLVQLAEEPRGQVVNGNGERRAPIRERGADPDDIWNGGSSVLCKESSIGFLPQAAIITGPKTVTGRLFAATTSGKHRLVRLGRQTDETVNLTLASNPILTYVVVLVMVIAQDLSHRHRR